MLKRSMLNTKTSFTDFFKAKKRSLGVRLDILDNVQLFETKDSIKGLMRFFRACGIKFVNIGIPRSRREGKTISLFAIDESMLTSAILGKSFSSETVADAAIRIFNGQDSQVSKPEFAQFCNANEYWLDRYSLFCALAKQIGTHDFTQWPDLLRACTRRTADIVKRQLQEEILLKKMLQFFLHKELELIKKFANEEEIFLCCDCDTLCEHISADVWADQNGFFINDVSKATVFTGLPPSSLCENGFKTTKVPHRMGNLKNTNYALFDRMFSRWQNLVDAIFLLDGHSIFQYWEIPQSEKDPKYGRWVNVPADIFFRHLDAHFNNFPYLFDFNEPLFPANEIISKRHNILQLAIDGEPTKHACDVYNLQRDLFALSSRFCNRKNPDRKTNLESPSAEVRSCLDHFRHGDYELCVLHFTEICNFLACEPQSVVKFSESLAKTFLLAMEERDSAPSPQTSPNVTEKNADSGPRSIIKKVGNFLKNLINID